MYQMFLPSYALVVSRDYVRIASTIAALNGLKLLVCKIQNAYLTADCREKIWTRAGPSSDLKPAVNIQAKDDKIEKPEMYLGAQLDQMFVNNNECWTMSAKKYTQASIKNVEETLAKKGLRFLPTKCFSTPLPTNYCPELDTSAELKSDGVQYFQELIGMLLRWAVEIVRLDILLETSLLSTHLAMPRFGHVEQVYWMFGYLKLYPKRKLVFDPQHPIICEHAFCSFYWHDFYCGVEEAIPGDMPAPRGNAMSTHHCFVDASHGSDRATRRSQTGILIFCNRALNSYMVQQATEYGGSQYVRERFPGIEECGRTD